MSRITKKIVKPPPRERQRRSTGGPPLKRVLGRTAIPEMTPAVMVDKREEFIRIWSDPTDGRTEAEVAKALGIDTALIRSWRSDPDVMGVVERQFRSALRGDMVSLWRSLRRSSEAGSLGASRLLLETLGVIEGKGNVNINMPGGAGPDAGAKLSDEALDREIQRLLLDTGAPDGLEWIRGALRPASYEVLDGSSQGSDQASVDGRDDTEDEQTDSLLSSFGETT